MRINTSSIKFKIVGLIICVGASLSFLLAFVAPKQAESMGARILEKNVEFIASQLVSNLALGMQTMILFDPCPCRFRQKLKGCVFRGRF